MRKFKLLLVAVLVAASFTACTSNNCADNNSTKTAGAGQVEALKAKNAALELKVTRVQNTYKKMMAEKIAENEKLTEENAKLKVEKKRIQNTFKGILAKELKEKEKLEAELKGMQKKGSKK